MRGRWWSLGWFLLAAVAAGGQVTAPASHGTSTTQQQYPATPSAAVVERLFRSRHPASLPDGSVPGRALLLERQELAKARQARALSAARPGIPASAAALASGILPGIQMRPPLPAGLLPTAVVAADVNRDGKQDLIEANGTGDDLWVSLGNGDGTFQLPTVVPVISGGSPLDVLAVDLRKRGVEDLLVAESDSNTVGVLAGNGDGTFAAEQVYALPAAPGRILAGDFNGDGWPDVLVALNGNAIGAAAARPYLLLFPGDGTGHLGAPVVSMLNSEWAEIDPLDIDAADVNGDGLLDVLVSGPVDVSIFLNQGAGAFTQGWTQPTTPYTQVLSGKLGDLNGDGCADVALGRLDGSVSVLPGDCSGNFAAETEVWMGEPNAALRLADVNGDGALDLIATSLPSTPEEVPSLGDALKVALGDGHGHFSEARTFAGRGQSSSLAVADFNGDGRLDVVTADSSQDALTLFTNGGGGDFGFPQGLELGVASGLSSLYDKTSLFVGPGMADLNGDGLTDLFFFGTGENGDNWVASFAGDGHGHFGAQQASDLGFSLSQRPGAIEDYRLVDVRGTGHLDLLTVGQDVSTSLPEEVIGLAPGHGDGTFGAITFTPAPGADGLMGVGDFNGDGKLDLVAVNGSSDHLLTPFLGRGDGTFAPGPAVHFGGSAGFAQSIYVLDQNGDGKLDVLVLESGNGYWTTGTTLWEFDGRGDGSFSAGQQVLQHFQPMTLADLNHDGHPDVVRYDIMWPDGQTETEGPARFTNYLRQPDATFAQSSSYAPYIGDRYQSEPENVGNQGWGDPLTNSLVGDLNGDGNVDEVAWQLTRPSVYAQILMGAGDGTFTPTYDIFPFHQYSYPAFARDLDGDGYTDLIEMDPVLPYMEVYRGTRAPRLQLTLDDERVVGNASCGWVYPDLVASQDRVATLFSSRPGVNLPATATIPAMSTAGRFCYTLAPDYNWRLVFDVNAQLEGDTATAWAADSYGLLFTLGLEPATTPAVYAGQTAGPTTVSLAADANYAGTVALSCPTPAAGLGCQFGTTPLTLSPSQTLTSSLSVSVPSGTAAGTYRLTVTGSDGTLSRSATLTVPVIALGVVLSPQTVTVAPGGSGTLNAVVTGIAPLQLACSGLPAEATCVAAPNGTSTTGGAYGITVSTTAGIALGSYPFTVGVTSQGRSASATATLVVSAGSSFATVLSAPTSWALPGTTVQVPLTLGTAGGLVSCALAGVPGATCTGGTGQPGGSLPLVVSVPAGAALGQHQLAVTVAGAQAVVFPFFVADYSGSLSTSAITLASSGGAQVTATLSATAGFRDQTAITCSAPAALVCSPTAASVLLIGTSPQNFVFQIARRGKAQASAGPSGRWWFALAGLLPLVGLGGARRRRALSIAVALVCAAMLGGLTACGYSGYATSGSASPAHNLVVTFTAAAMGTGTTRPVGTVTVTAP